MPSPSRGAIDRELDQIRDLGFNCVKACLWVPTEEWLSACDAAGVLVWMELPLWLPELTEALRSRVVAEYDRLLRQLRRHPCIVVWTLGCELQSNVDAALLGTLYSLARQRTGSPLIRDNSGSAECYGGPAEEHADFDDYHVYCEPPCFRATVDYFAPGWRSPRPWLFGEYADCDALRDLPAVVGRAGASPPWWTRDDPRANPQGVRWEYAVVRQSEQLARHGLLDQLPALNRSSRLQAELVRRLTIEETRAMPFTAGYVVTGWRDTPISTAGVIDDFGELKHDAARFRRFNADTVLLRSPERRRAWTNGGDRPSYTDRYHYWSSSVLRWRIGASCYGRPVLGGEASWRLLDSQGAVLGSGAVAASPVSPGTVGELASIEVQLPAASAPRELLVEVACGDAIAAWPVWVHPALAPGELSEGVRRLDPDGRLEGLELLRGQPEPWSGEADALLIATWWTDKVERHWAAGGRVLYLERGGGGLPVDRGPFWREAMKLFAPHAVWNGFPHAGWTDERFYGLTPDAYFDCERMRHEVADCEVAPILSRVDALARRRTRHDGARLHG
jgi:hypothetical protein